MRKFLLQAILMGPLVVTAAPYAHAASSYGATETMFKNSGPAARFFSSSYAYALFPTITAGALGVGAAHGYGRVYVNGHRAGRVSMTQLSVGVEAGGKEYSQIVFFEDKRALDEFESGNFEFGADANVVAVTAGAGASAGTNGTETGTSGGKNDADLNGHYQKGMVVFTIAKGGLMFQAAVAGQKFKFTPSGKPQ